MKRTEIAMIILIASLSMILTFTLVRSVLGDKIERTATVKEAVEISDEIEQPAKRVFNDKAINPTVEVCVQTDTVDVNPTDADADEPATTTKDCDAASSASTDEADASVADSTDADTADATTPDDEASSKENDN